MTSLFMTTHETCQRLGITYRQLHSGIINHLPHLQVTNNTRLFLRDYVEAFLTFVHDSPYKRRLVMQARDFAATAEAKACIALGKRQFDQALGANDPFNSTQLATLLHLDRSVITDWCRKEVVKSTRVPRDNNRGAKENLVIAAKDVRAVLTWKWK
jgi:hypothetical protein